MRAGERPLGGVDARMSELRVRLTLERSRAARPLAGGDSHGGLLLVAEPARLDDPRADREDLGAGAHADADAAAQLLEQGILAAFDEIDAMDPGERRRERRAKYRVMGVLAAT